MTFDRNYVPMLAKKARLKFDRHEQQHMIVYPERGLLLNEAAAAIAEKFDGKRSIGVIADELAREHQGDPKAIEEDVIVFVGELFEKGLLLVN